MTALYRVTWEQRLKPLCICCSSKWTGSDNHSWETKEDFFDTDYEAMAQYKLLLKWINEGFDQYERRNATVQRSATIWKDV